jgi:hypothetical protein
MGSKKAIIIASAIICILLLTILYMDYRIRTLEGGVDITEEDTANVEETTDAETDASEETITVETTTETNTTEDTTEVDDTEETTEDAEEELSKEIGTLEIISYPDGADVYLGDDKIGTTPYKNFSFPVGNHSIIVKKTDYGNYCKTAYVYKNTIEKITALMDASKSIGCGATTTTTDDDDDDEEEEEEEVGTEFTTEPTGAEVKINGQSKGTTPVFINLEEGESLLKISKSGYKTYSVFISINADGKITSIDDDSQQNGNFTKEDDFEYLFEIDE